MSLELWDSIKTTDQAYTSVNTEGRRKSTSINAHYMIREATKQFGPIGIGWGYEILDEYMRDGAQNFINVNNVRELDGTAKSHTIKLKLWYKVGDEKGEIIDFGHTKYMYYSKKGGYWVCDEEVGKKSLTDAIKRCLSKIGFCADIYLGEFDNQEYQAEAAQEIYIEKENAKIDKFAAKQQAESEQHQQFINEIESAENENELKKSWVIISNKCLLMTNGTKRQAQLMKHYTKKIEGFK